MGKRIPLLTGESENNESVIVISFPQHSIMLVLRLRMDNYGQLYMCFLFLL